MQIFNPRYSTISDYMHDLPPLGTLNPFFQTLKELGSMSTPIAVKWEKENEKIPF
jgi:hypothetical protein